MRLFLKILACIVLLATAGAAAISAYAWLNRFPVCSSGSVQAVPAADLKEQMEIWMSQAEKNAFPGKVCFNEQEPPNADDSQFVQYTIRLSNKGFFPAEWISVETEPGEGDLMILDSGSANVLNAGEDGDVSLLILQRMSGKTERDLTVTCYVFGEKHIMNLSAAADGIREKEEK